MKILFVSMRSIHFIRWTENLRETDHELYWFDVLGRGEIGALDFVNQFTNWKKRKLPYIKGEYFLSKKAPLLYEKISPYLEVSSNEALNKIILEIQPDIIHSFEMQSCSYPILKTMNKFRNLKWIYSCWGSDMYYYQNFKNHNPKIKAVLKRVDFLLTDCERDHRIARELGYNNQFLGAIPGGSGYKLKELEPYQMPVNERKIILVKGYEHRLGRSINVVKALQSLENEIKDYVVIIFGSHQKVIDYLKQNKLDFKFYNRNELSNQEVIRLMGKSLLYIGNSISDGIPNTLLEAIIMGAFPIQTNPGNATSEIIDNEVNGYLINNPNDIEEIKKNIGLALQDLLKIQKALEINKKISEEKLEYEFIKMKILNIYNESRL